MTLDSMLSQQGFNIQVPLRPRRMRKRLTRVRQMNYWDFAQAVKDRGVEFTDDPQFHQPD